MKMTININKTYMTSHYNWAFPQRQDTMYMSTIENKPNFAKITQRESTFKMRDIQGTSSKQNIPTIVNKQSYINSTFIEPRPQLVRSLQKISNPLQISDIQGTSPCVNGFKTARVVNPLQPKYKLPNFNAISEHPIPKFLRNTLDVSDIVDKRQPFRQVPSSKTQQINGSSPNKLFQTIDAISRLDVKDINNDGKFVSERRNNPTDPLNPQYNWQDKIQDGKTYAFTRLAQSGQFRQLNRIYGNIEGSQPKRLIPLQSKRQSSLNIKDVEGAHSNSMNEHRYFINKRTQFRNYMKHDDIQKSYASSLKKGIVTSWNVNPMMPNYNFPL